MVKKPKVTIVIREEVHYDGDFNQEMVKAALDRTGGNKAKAARHLGVGRATLYRFLEEFPDVS